jgi:hypothetical protein
MMTESSRLSSSKALEELLYDRKGQALERLVDKKHSNVARKSARCWHYPLLVAGQDVCSDVEPLADPREVLEDAPQIPSHPMSGPRSSELEVLSEGHSRENAARISAELG